MALIAGSAWTRSCPGYQLSIKADSIRARQEYGGVRVKLMALLPKTRIPVQIDVGFGDAVTPGIHH